jgi:hypothetical protein
VAAGGDVQVNTIDIDTNIEIIKKNLRKPALLCLWELHALGQNGYTGFFFKSSYTISQVVRENQKVKIFIDVQMFDAWDLFQERAKRIFIGLVKEQIADQFPGIEEDILDVVVEE